MKSLSEYLKNNNDILDVSLRYEVMNQRKDIVKLKSLVFNNFKYKDLDGYEKYRNSYVITENNIKIPTTMILIK